MKNSGKEVKPLEVFNEEQYQDALRKLQTNLNRVNAVLRAFTALDFGELKIEEFGKLINNPEGFVREKALDKELVKLNGMNVDRAAFGKMLAVPDLTNLHRACREAKEAGNISAFLTIKDGEAFISDEYMARLKEYATVRFDDERHVKIYELAQTIAAAGNEIRELCAGHSEQTPGKSPLDMLFYIERGEYKPHAKSISKL